MSKHMKAHDITWRELFNEIKRYAERDGEGVWDLPVYFWYDDDIDLHNNRGYTFSGVDQELYSYPSYKPVPLSDDNWLMLLLHNPAN